ncbi:hypothetical protein FRX31_021370 [Thalictrum thalictroides]|uniref:DUF7734 domain-containing protein n=1 Tax=Thalictrum thalictroides TaxID=46969 RepID=A0A7J6VW05_THATH|nr:hypothetical protein FRX31_021370 [Thalictrum thalictroides]
MLKQCTILSSLSLPSKPIPPVFLNRTSLLCVPMNIYLPMKTFKLHEQEQVLVYYCRARRRVVRYEDDEGDDYEDEEYGHNPDIVLLESYSESARNEALLVRAMVDDQQEEILVFKGFSSCLSYSTSSDPSKSILPARAVITSIDRIIGPFDPTNIEYIEKSLTWDTFKTRLEHNRP